MCTALHFALLFHLNVQLDDPEDVFTGLELAMGMDWQSRVRVIIHAGRCRRASERNNCIGLAVRAHET